MNAGIREAHGDVIMPMGAHAVYSASYISRLVAALEETGADNVGGVLVTLPANGTPLARALAIGLSHPFGVGNSYFRIGAAERRLVDTVPFGCYRRAVFDRDRKSTRLNSSHQIISYAVFCLKKKKKRTARNST